MSPGRVNEALDGHVLSQRPSVCQGTSKRQVVDLF